METMTTFKIGGCCSGCGQLLQPNYPPSATAPWTFIQIGDKAFHSGCVPKEPSRARTEAEVYESVLAQLLGLDGEARARLLDRLLRAVPMPRGGAIADPNHDHECG